MTSKRYNVRIRGDMACFTRPELKVERVTYPAITPTAAKGVLDSILWKPAIRWSVHKITILAKKNPKSQPIEYISFRRNEVKDKMSNPLRKDFKPYLDIVESRTQRNTMALRDVDYAIECSFTVMPRSGDHNNVEKFNEMFTRRMDRGQYFRSPCLGCREFPAIVEWYEGDPGPADIPLMPIGLMNYGVWNNAGQFAPQFFPATIENGVILIP